MDQIFHDLAANTKLRPRQNGVIENCTHIGTCQSNKEHEEASKNCLQTISHPSR